MGKAREQTRWFPAMVGNHVADLVERYGKTGASVPQRLTDYIEGRKGYDYHHHADKDADHLGFINEDIIDSFGVLGTVEQHVEKLKELEVDRRDPVQHLPDVRRRGADRRGVRQARTPPIRVSGVSVVDAAGLNLRLQNSPAH